MKRALCLATLLAFVSPVVVAQPPAPAAQPAPAKGYDAGTIARRAIAYLRGQQDKASGGWSIPTKGPAFPAISALAVEGMLMEPGITGQDPSVEAGVKYILSLQQPDGGIYDKVLPSYNTAICLKALSRLAPSPRVDEARRHAQDFLRSIQFGEGAAPGVGMGDAARPVSRDDPYYGGWGYGSHGRPDLSNSAFVIEALRASGVPETDPCFQRALVFLQRCQMADRAGPMEINDRDYAKGSAQGGFIYSTSVDKDHVGIGQSQAGEIAESLSGPPGAVARVVLKEKDAEGKPIRLSRAQVIDRIREHVKLSSDLHAGEFGDNLMVVLGPTPDGETASSFEVRAATTRVDLFERTIGQALADVASRVEAHATDHWQGASRLRAYGSMTYAGFKSYLYAGLRADDPRVVMAREWISRNYTLAENPGMGTDGYYYYLLTFARAMDASGSRTVEAVAEDGKTSSHAWDDELIARLSSLQNPDGSFRAVDDRWMENNPVLITAYSLLALQHARHGR